jgi:hypothetical protein
MSVDNFDGGATGTAAEHFHNRRGDFPKFFCCSSVGLADDEWHTSVASIAHRRIERYPTEQWNP